MTSRQHWPSREGCMHCVLRQSVQSLMELMLRHSAAYQDTLLACLAERPSTRANPWRITFYADKAAPGNLLKIHNKKISMVMYWSWEQYGPERLSRKACWHLGGIVRADRLKNIAGGF